MRIQISTTTLLVLVCVFGLGGCSKGPADNTAKEDGGHEHSHGHHHDHGEEGPHGGHIIELGTESHHAELTHDDATNKVGVYILGGDAKTAAPIAAESVTINVAADGVPSQYVLEAAPQEGEAAGQSSYFEVVSEPLCKVVAGESEAKKTVARLSLSIDDKPFVGMIETSPHDHDHDHDHDHGDNH